MKNLNRLSDLTALLIATSILTMIGGVSAVAANTVITLNSNATDLTSPASYTPAIAPNATTDILFSAGNTYGATTLTVNANTVTGSVNDANAAVLTITNNGGAPDTFSLSAAAGTNNTAVTGASSVNDVVFVKNGSNLTIANGVNALTIALTTGGNIDNAGTLSISSGVTIANGNTVILTGAGVTTISGSIAATSGQLVLNDAGGRVVLSGTNLYTGGTTINAGTLVVGSAGALGTGPVTNNALLETTASTTLGSAPRQINVNNTFTQGVAGNLQLQVVIDQGPPPTTPATAGIDYDTLSATGAVTVAGTIGLNFQAAAAPTQGERFQVISSLAGPITGAIPVTVTGTVNPLFIPITTYNDSFGGTYAANNVVVTLFQPFTSFGGLTPNQVSVATNVDSNLAILSPGGVLGTPTGATKDFFDNIVTGLTLASYSPNSLGAALDQLSPQRFEILHNVAFDNYAFDVQSLDNEFARERNGRGGIDTSGFAFNDSALGSQLSQIKGRLLAWNPAPEAHGLLSDSLQNVLGGVKMSDSKDMKEMTPEAVLNKWNGFVDGGVDLGDLEHNSDVSHSSYTTGRVRGGIDYRVTRDFRVGALFGYGHTDADLDNEGSKAHIDSYTPGIYATYADKKGFYANGLFTYTRNDYSTDRNIVIPGVNRTASGSPSGDQFGGDLDGGYEFHKGNWTFGPSAGLTYVNLGIDSFSESGASAADLSVNNQSADSLRSRLGGTVRYDAKLGSVVITPHLSAFWQHEFLNGSNSITSQFEGLPAGSFEVQTTDGDSDNALLGAGIDAEVTNNLTLFVDYETEAGGSTFFGQSASGGVKVSF
jgi:autotransporter-associated beta strand protein